MLNIDFGTETYLEVVEIELIRIGFNNDTNFFKLFVNFWTTTENLDKNQIYYVSTCICCNTCTLNV